MPRKVKLILNTQNETVFPLTLLSISVLCEYGTCASDLNTPKSFFSVWISLRSAFSTVHSLSSYRQNLPKNCY